MKNSRPAIVPSAFKEAFHRGTAELSRALPALPSSIPIIEHPNEPTQGVHGPRSMIDQVIKDLKDSPNIQREMEIDR